MYKIIAENKSNNWSEVLETIKGNQSEAIARIRDIKKNGHNKLNIDDLADIRLFIDNGINRKNCGGLK